MLFRSAASVIFSTIFHCIPSDKNTPGALKYNNLDSYLKNIAWQAIQDSFVYSNLPTITPIIDTNLNILSTSIVYSTYQWYADTVPIPGANSYKYIAGNDTLNYWVQTTDANGCSFRSFPVNLFSKSGIADNDYTLHFKIYPNPTDGHISIRAIGLSPYSVTCSIYNIMGEKNKTLMLNPDPSGSLQQNINISSYAKGVYFIELVEGDKRFVQKVVVE